MKSWTKPTRQAGDFYDQAEGPEGTSKQIVGECNRWEPD